MNDKTDQNNEVPLQVSDSNQNEFVSSDSALQQNKTLDAPVEKTLDLTIEDCVLNLSNVISKLDLEFSSLKHIIDERLSYDKVKEESFERLYKELDEYKKNNIFNHNRQLYMDIILLFDRIKNIHDGINQSNSFSEEFKLILKTLTDELLEMLFRQGIEIIVPIIRKFDPTIQRAIGIEHTSKEEENNQIFRVVRRGFRYGNIILRAEEVIVMKYKDVIP